MSVTGIYRMGPGFFFANITTERCMAIKLMLKYTLSTVVA